MGTLQKLDMLNSLDAYLGPNKRVKIIRIDGSIIVGEFVSRLKGPSSELFEGWDPEEILLKVKLKVESVINPVEISFRDIANYEPID